FNVSILVRHKPVLKPVLEPFCLCRLSGRNGGQFRSYEAPHDAVAKIKDRLAFYADRFEIVEHSA
ncbi:hypothetical protein ASG68_08210, partial [Rhizobium sp. Leaf453]